MTSKNKIAYGLLVIVFSVEACFSMNKPISMKRSISQIKEGVALHNELSLEESEALEAALSSHGSRCLRSEFCTNIVAVELTEHALDAILPFIKKDNDPLLIELLFWAISRRKEAMVRVLIEQGRVEANAVDRYGKAPLRQAVLSRLKDNKALGIVRYLLEKGADIDAMDPVCKNTPLAGLVDYKLSSLWGKSSDVWSTMRLLLEYGASTKHVNAKGQDLVTFAEELIDFLPLYYDDGAGARRIVSTIRNLIAEIEQEKKDGLALTGALPEALDGLLPEVLHPEVGSFVNKFYGWQES